MDETESLARIEGTALPGNLAFELRFGVAMRVFLVVLRTLACIEVQIIGVALEGVVLA